MTSLYKRGTYIDDYEDLPPEISGNLAESLEGDYGTLGTNHSYEDDKRDAATDVRNALQRRRLSGDSTSIIDLLSLTAPAKQSYWTEVAQELHHQREHYEALYAWNQAANLKPDEFSEFSFELMGWELWNASDFGAADAYLAECAAQAFEKQQVWVAVAAINQALGKSEEIIIGIIETALRTSGSFDLDDCWHIHGGIDGLEFNEPWTWGDLAYAYIRLNNLPKAFEAWAMFAREDEDKAITSAIEFLIYEARDRGYSDKDVVPDPID